METIAAQAAAVPTLAVVGTVSAIDLHIPVVSSANSLSADTFLLPNSCIYSSRYQEDQRPA